MARLVRDISAHIRAIQMSERRIFGYCEGRDHDPHIYSNLARSSLNADAFGVVIFRVEEIAGTGGKSGVTSLYEEFRRRRLLKSSFKNKKFCSLFFMDKDIDDLLKKIIRCPHVFYTEFYDLESHFYIESDLAAAVAAAASLTDDEIPARYADPRAWAEAKAHAWKEWLTLCIYSRTFGVDAGCGYSRPSQINLDLIAPTDANLFSAFKTILLSADTTTLRTKKRRLSKILGLLENYRSRGDLHVLFKGKWFEAIIEKELQHDFRGKPVQINGCGSKITAITKHSYDLSSAWADRHRQQIASITQTL
jgi:hypothetical protein